MKNCIYFWKMIICLVSCLYPFMLNASPIEQEADDHIVALYHNPVFKKNRHLAERIAWFSEQFLGKHYLLGALGEGSSARYDQFPLYRTDAFDCETLVDTVMALALSHDVESFKKNLLKIRYKSGKRAYIYRNHFTDLDWNINNQQQGLIKDITSTFKNTNIRVAEAEINKPSWYAMRPLSTIRLEKPTPEEIKKRLALLIKKGKSLPIQKVSLPYLPLSDLFDAEGHANHAIFEQIPQAAIIEIIRPNWNLRKTIGTNLNVSHLGFAIWKNKVLYFREASSQAGRVVDVPLEAYLKDLISSPTIKGINVEVVLPGLK